MIFKGLVTLCSAPSIHTILHHAHSKGVDEDGHGDNDNDK